MRAHFFEGGNVQFQQKKVLNKPFQFTGNMEDNAKAIMKEIEMF